jgi:hypothetical protein
LVGKEKGKKNTHEMMVQIKQGNDLSLILLDFECHLKSLQTNTHNNSNLQDLKKKEF